LRHPSNRWPREAVIFLLDDAGVNLFFLLIAAHLCGDLLVYSDNVSEAKRKGELRSRVAAIGFHCLVHACWVWVWLWPQGIERKITAGFFVFIAHFIIDFTRIYVEPRWLGRDKIKILKRREVLRWLGGQGDNETRIFMKTSFVPWLTINVVDQSLHLVAIIGFVYFLA